MKRMKLTLQQEFSKEEYEVLRIMRQVLLDTSDGSIYSWAKTTKSKELAVILHHLLFSCRDSLGSIFTLMHDYGYFSIYIIGATLVEYFIDFSFILKIKELAGSRAKEYFNALKDNRKPFLRNKKYHCLEQRAKEAGLTSLYNKTYRSLCSFKHVNLKGHLTTRRDDKLKKDRKIFMLQMTNLYLEMWQTLNDYLNNRNLNVKIRGLLNKEFVEIEGLIKKDLIF